MLFDAKKIVMTKRSQKMILSARLAIAGRRGKKSNRYVVSCPHHKISTELITLLKNNHVSSLISPASSIDHALTSRKLEIQNLSRGKVVFGF